MGDAAAVFAEPLAAACRIVEQGLVPPDADAAVLGDGKLGLLVAEVLARRGAAAAAAAAGMNCPRWFHARALERQKILRNVSESFLGSRFDS